MEFMNVQVKLISRHTLGKLQAAANPLAAKVPTLVNLGTTEDLVFKRALALAEFVEYAGKIYLWHAEPEEASDGYLSCTTASGGGAWYTMSSRILYISSYC